MNDLFGILLLKIFYCFFRCNDGCFVILLHFSVFNQINLFMIYIVVRQQLQILKVDICKQCKKNFELEKEVRFFDQRIALLINHKITVDVSDNFYFSECK